MIIKKTTFVLLIFVMLALSSCVSIQDTASSDSLSGKAPLDVVGQYLSLEEIVAASDVLLKGQCVNSIIETDHAEYEFNVLQVYRGRVESQKINVYVPYYNVTILDKNNLEYKTDDVSYVFGEKYLLVLLDRSNVYSGNRYINAGGNLFIPASSIKSSSIYGESLLKHSDLGSLTTEEKLLTYLCMQYDLMANGKADGSKITYINDTNINEVIARSDYILQIKVAEEVYIGSAKDRNTYDCTVTDAIYGNINNGELVRIVFPSGSVKIGDEIIASLFEFENTSPRSFVLSSQSGLFSVNQKSDIIDILNSR